MYIFKRVKDLKHFLDQERSGGNSIGFVPTMGALHDGHISLVQRSREENPVTVCSIFVNPTQFNEAADLEKYPRTPEKDIEMLQRSNCQVLFMPPVEEVYPANSPQIPSFDFGKLDKTMEGAQRPGHFAGVAQVVYRLLSIVEPDALYMGQKDFQQVAIVRHMLSVMNSPVRLISCPIVREADGLALSSRNVRLSDEQRRIAPNIYRTLLDAQEMVPGNTPGQISAKAMKMLSIPGMEPEYFRIVDGDNLQELDTFEDVSYAVACTAVRLGEVRLIDNMVLAGGS